MPGAAEKKTSLYKKLLLQLEMEVLLPREIRI